MRFAGFWLGFLTLGSSVLAAQPESLNAMLEKVRVQYGVPGMTAVFIRDGAIIAQGAAGVRKAGSNVRVTMNDKFHIGSCTKSMTATLTALMIEQGRLRWDTTLAEELRMLSFQMRPAWKNVTLLQLLSNHGGAPNDLEENGLWTRLWKNSFQLPRDQRVILTRELTRSTNPVATPGTKFVYSNAGFAMVGHVIEKKEGGKWEDIIRRRLFSPLGLRSAGFGAPARVGRVDQPWGHNTGPDGKPEPVKPGREADNPAAIGPAGTVHMSTLDLASYVIFHLRGARGEATPVLIRESFTKLHTPHFPPHDYALGWGTGNWSLPGRNLGHDGSNTMFYTVVRFAPEANMAMVINANWASDAAKKAVYEVFEKLTTKYAAND